MKKVFAVCLLLAVLVCSTTLLACNSSPVYDVTIAEKQTNDFNTSVNIVGDKATTPSSKIYAFSGYSDLQNYTIGNTLTIKFDLPDRFNKYFINYLSDQPVKAEIFYKTTLGKDKSETIYLESGKNTFSGLIDGFLDKKHGKGFYKIIVYKLKENTSFLLCDYSTAKVSAPSGDTVYLTNGRYKLGVYLSNGGGLSYLSDAKSDSLGGKNLLNNFDEGRLVQQSYYGTSGNEEYTAGEYNNSKWCYNPVQGGDKYGNESKIIDYVCNGQSIYVKCQPLDWASDNFFTPSYMESTYTVYPDRIKVDCRFLDFSGWTHTFRDQELPAFYSISYLDTFTCYQGDSPWSEDALTVYEDMPFWGDSSNRATCRISASQESWCAWTDSPDGYGIGLYTPGVTALFAGRFGDGHSKKADDDSCSYIAPLKKVQLKSYEPFEYSYLLTTGNVSEIRNVIYANRTSVEK